MGTIVALINLEAARARRRHMTAQLAPTGLAWRRFGVDLRNVDEAGVRRALDAHAGALQFHRGSLSNAEIGCWLSHANAWRWRFAAREPAALTVLEDDVVLAPAFAGAVAQVEALGIHDVTFLGTSSRNVSLRTRVEVGDVAVHRPRGAIFNTWGYVIRRRYAEQLLSGAAGMIRWPIDHVLGGRIAALRPDVGVARPPMVEEERALGADSQIQPTTRRMDRSKLVESMRRRLLGSRAGDLYYALYRWL